MVAVITKTNRGAYAEQLRAMHRDRARIFVEAWRWRLPVTGDGLEIDQYDTDDAIYLVDFDADCAHLASLRLLPTTRPHLMSDMFPDLCADGPVVGDDVWEISRLCTSPELPQDRHRPMRNRLARAMLEFGFLFGITRFVGVTNLQYLSRMLAFGWECMPLGLPKEMDGVPVGAFVIDNSPASIEAFRARTGTRFPALQLDRDLAA
ncbi:MAG: autoinducer synthase [Alphaproteobacteria bacterium]|nr:autoinducer synthase [Alphaproteobacteria bacterium]